MDPANDGTLAEPVKTVSSSVMVRSLSAALAGVAANASDRLAFFSTVSSAVTGASIPRFPINSRGLKSVEAIWPVTVGSVSRLATFKAPESCIPSVSIQILDTSISWSANRAVTSPPNLACNAPSGNDVPFASVLSNRSLMLYSCLLRSTISLALPSTSACKSMLLLMMEKSTLRSNCFSSSMAPVLRLNDESLASVPVEASLQLTLASLISIPPTANAAMVALLPSTSVVTSASALPSSVVVVVVVVV